MSNINKKQQDKIPCLDFPQIRQGIRMSISVLGTFRTSKG